MIVVFTPIKFFLIEVPIVSYTISPARASVQVSRSWMHAKRLQVIAVVVGVIGFVLVVRAHRRR